MSRAVVGDDAGGGAVREDSTTSSASSMQFPRRSTREMANANERANSGREVGEFGGGTHDVELPELDGS